MGPIGGSESDAKWFTAGFYTLLGLAVLGLIALFALLCWGVVALAQHLEWVG